MKISPALIKKGVSLAFHPWLWRFRPLGEKDLSPDPYEQFGRWYRSAGRCFWSVFPEAMCLSTIDSQGMPDSRVVLLKHFDEAGFVFYTNTNSAKGRALGVHPQAALAFYWEALQRQVRIQGAVEPVSAEEADAYFASRPRGSRIGAWASLQSEPLTSRAVLEERVGEFRRRYAGGEVPRPPHWSGYRVRPVKFEFWQIRPSRLHDRFIYLPAEGGRWSITRLYP